MTCDATGLAMSILGGHSGELRAREAGTSRGGRARDARLRGPLELGAAPCARGCSVCESERVHSAAPASASSERGELVKGESTVDEEWSSQLAQSAWLLDG